MYNRYTLSWCYDLGWCSRLFTFVWAFVPSALASSKLVADARLSGDGGQGSRLEGLRTRRHAFSAHTCTSLHVYICLFGNPGTRIDHWATACSTSTDQLFGLGFMGVQALPSGSRKHDLGRGRYDMPNLQISFSEALKPCAHMKRELVQGPQLL